MGKLIISVAFAVAFAIFLAIKFVVHHVKVGVKEAKKATDAIDIGAISPALDNDLFADSSHNREP
jgi:hypothetical protein